MTQLPWFAKAASGAVAILIGSAICGLFGLGLLALHRNMVGVLILIVTTHAIAVVIYAILTGMSPAETPDPETRCRKCQYILRGITEPRCPECGERI